MASLIPTGQNIPTSVITSLNWSAIPNVSVRDTSHNCLRCAHLLMIPSTCYSMFQHTLWEPENACLPPNIHSVHSLFPLSGLPLTRNAKMQHQQSPGMKLHMLHWQFALMFVNEVILALNTSQSTPTNTAIKQLHSSHRWVTIWKHPFRLEFHINYVHACVWLLQFSKPMVTWLEHRAIKQWMQRNFIDIVQLPLNSPISLLMPLRNLWKLLEMTSINHLRSD